MRWKYDTIHGTIYAVMYAQELWDAWLVWCVVNSVIHDVVIYMSDDEWYKWWYMYDVWYIVKMQKYIIHMYLILYEEPYDY
jgi:hypothetical protein